MIVPGRVFLRPSVGLFHTGVPLCGCGVGGTRHDTPSELTPYLHADHLYHIKTFLYQLFII